ncbi:hypothetical protein [Corynebacterium urealyticum]|uniref:hypothetical protein n=1 Tax=Corynebacterium urealyticum TaxID=43771 RepID=UPI00293F3A5F|nr:hypothetical protein [Corynebacterium urealyticum]WOH94987.1 hypothetical protein RZ943_03055 [Corynebacterium urealyticum]
MTPQPPTQPQSGESSRTRAWWRTISGGMWIIGVATLARGVSYLPPLVNADREAAHFLETLLPPTAWAWVWLAAGVVALVASVCHRLLPLALGGAVGLHTLWALSFVGATVTGDVPRGWVSAIGYAGIAALAVWGFSRADPEKPRVSQGGD